MSLLWDARLKWVNGSQLLIEGSCSPQQLILSFESKLLMSGGCCFREAKTKHPKIVFFCENKWQENMEVCQNILTQETVFHYTSIHLQLKTEDFSLYYCMQVHWTDPRHPVLRPWVHSSDVRGECCYVNGNSTTTILHLTHHCLLR